LISVNLHGALVVEDRPGNGRGAWLIPGTEHVANEPIALHVLDALEAAGVGDIVVVSSKRSAPIVRECLTDVRRARRARIRFVDQTTPLDLTAALSLVAPIVRDAPCIVHSAGGLLAESLTSLAECLDDGPDAVLMAHHAAPPDRRLSRAVQSLLHLAELDEGRSALGLAEVWAFGPGGLRSVVAGGRASPAAAGKGDHPGGAGPLDVSALAERIAFGGGTLHVRLVDVWRAYRGDADELLELNRLVLDRIQSDLPPNDLGDNRIEGRVRIHERASVRSSVIVGPVVIGADARIRDAYVGPYTAIGAGALIQGAEVERSIISSGASINHVSARITASIVGRNARLFRDFSLPRALRLRVGDGAEVGLC
jgi:glucose-1-phosphate thymidylyltransferase